MVVKITVDLLCQLGAAEEPKDPGCWTLRVSGRSFWFRNTHGAGNLWTFAEHGGAPAHVLTLAECLAHVAGDAYDRGWDECAAADMG